MIKAATTKKAVNDLATADFDVHISMYKCSQVCVQDTHWVRMPALTVAAVRRLYFPSLIIHSLIIFYFYLLLFLCPFCIPCWATHKINEVCCAWRRTRCAIYAHLDATGLSAFAITHYATDCCCCICRHVSTYKNIIVFMYLQESCSDLELVAKIVASNLQIVPKIPIYVCSNGEKLESFISLLFNWKNLSSDHNWKQVNKVKTHGRINK